MWVSLFLPTLLHCVNIFRGGENIRWKSIHKSRLQYLAAVFLCIEFNGERRRRELFPGNFFVIASFFAFYRRWMLLLSLEGLKNNLFGCKTNENKIFSYVESCAATFRTRNMLLCSLKIEVIHAAKTLWADKKWFASVVCACNDVRFWRLFGENVFSRGIFIDFSKKFVGLYGVEIYWNCDWIEILLRNYSDARLSEDKKPLQKPLKFGICLNQNPNW